MRKLDLMILLLRSIQNAKKTYVSIGSPKVKETCYVYEDKDVFFSLTRLTSFPRTIVKHIDTHTLSVYQPALRCMSTIPNSLSIYMYLKLENPIEMNKNTEKKLKIYRKIMTSNYPTLYMTIEKLPESFDNIILADLSESNIETLISCMFKSTLYARDRWVFYVGSA